MDILERDSLHLLSHQEKTETATRLTVRVCLIVCYVPPGKRWPRAATTTGPSPRRRSVNAGATRKTPLGFPITAHSTILTTVAVLDAASTTDRQATAAPAWERGIIPQPVPPMLQALLAPRHVP